MAPRCRGSTAVRLCTCGFSSLLALLAIAAVSVCLLKLVMLADEGGPVLARAADGGSSSSSSSSSGSDDDVDRLESRLRYPHRPRVLGLVGVQTGFGSVERRQALRDTWFPSNPEEHRRLSERTGLVFRFIIGRGKSDVDERLLQEEISRYNDFIRIDVGEAYLNLNHKTLAYFTAMFRMYEAEFYVKADDDIYLHPERLSLLIGKPRASPRTYLGCLKKGQVFTNPKLKWYEPKSWLLGSEYFLHAYGPIYALSYDVVNILNAIPKGRLRMFLNEDVSVGAWMLAFDVSHEMSWPLCSRNCTSDAIAVWDIPTCAGLCHPEMQMRQLHADPVCSANKLLQKSV